MKRFTRLRFFRALLISAFLLALLPARVNAQTWQWAQTHQASGANQSFVYAAATDAAGNTVLAGNFTGTIALGSFTLTSAGSQDVFVARLSPTGAWLQAVRGGGAGYDHANALALDPAGNATVGGYFLASSTTFGTSSLSNLDNSGNSSDLFLATLSPAGAWTRALRAGSQGMDQVRGLAYDAGGTATVVGSFAAVPGAAASTTLTFGSFQLINSSGFYEDLFVARLSPAGTWTQALSAGDNGMDQATAVAVDAAGNATITGTFSSSTIRFGSTQLSNTTSGVFYTDVFVARLSAAGQWTQAVRAGGADTDKALALALDASGAATVVGSFSSPSMGFGSSSLANSGNPPNPGTDLFVARLSPAGTWTQASSAGGPGSEQAMAVALDAAGNATVTGYFSSSTLTIGSTSLVNANTSVSSPGTDIFVARLSPSGTWDRVSGAGGVGSEEAAAVLLDAAGYPTIAGTISSQAVRFGSLTVGSSTTSAVIARQGPLASAARQPRPAGSLRLSPNPARGTVQLALPAMAATTLRVLDAMGRELRRQDLPAQTTTAQVDLQGLPAGLYTLRCGTASGRLTVE